MSIVKVVQNELKEIIAEARKRHNLIKEASERVSLLLKAIQERNKDSQTNEALAKSMRSNEEIIKPFLLCCESKNTKLITLSLSALHKLVSHSAIPDGGIGIIVETIYRLLGETDEVVQLKIYQLGLMVLTANQCDINQFTLSRLFSIFFQLLENKSVSIQQTGIVTLRQACSVLFEKAQDKKIENAHLLLLDLAHFAAGENGRWIKVSSIPSKLIVFELIEHVATSYSDILLMEEFSPIVTERILPLIFHKCVDFSETLRIYQVATCLARKYVRVIGKDTIKILQLIASDLGAPWKRVLALEAVRTLFEDQKFLEAINVDFDYKKENLFDIMITVVRDSLEKFLSDKFVYKIHQYDRLTSYHSNDAFQPTTEEILSICLDSLNALSKSIASIIGIKDIVTSNVKKSHCSLVEASWVGILSCLAELLEKCTDDETVQVILRSYLLYTIISGVTDLSTPRDAFLTSLCSYTLPMDPNEQNLSSKHLQVSKVLFNIAHIIGEYLGSSWYVLLKNFQKLDNFLRPNEREATAKLISEGNQSLSNLAKDLSSLFSDTKSFHLDSLIVLVKQLVHLAEDSNTQGFFADQRLIENIHINITRIDLIWEFVALHLINVAINPNTSKFGIDSITGIISATCNDPVMSQMEVKLFSVFTEVYKSDHCKRQVVLAITSIIQKSGQVLSTSWKSILVILQDASQRDTEISLAFKCVQLIGNDFLPTVSPFISEFITTVAAFTRQVKSDDVNTNLVAIGLFMTIGDFLQSSGLPNLNDLWLFVFMQLVDASTDLRYEVRNSAIKTLTFAITSQGRNLDSNGWNSCVRQVIIPILLKVHEHAFNAETTDAEGLSALGGAKTGKKMYLHHSRDTVAKQWCETRRLNIEGFSRILFEYSKTISTVDSYLDYCRDLINFFHHSVRVAIAELTHGVVVALFDILPLKEPIIWEGAWKIWEEIAHQSSKASNVDKQTILAIVDGFFDLHNKKSFNVEDLDRSLELCSIFFQCGHATGGVIFPSRIQEQILHYYQSISSPKIFEVLLRTLPTAESVKDRKSLPPASFCLAIVKNLASGTIHSLPKMVEAIHVLFSTRKLEAEYPIWKSVVKPFCELIVKYDDAITSGVVEEICTMIENFVFYEKHADEEEAMLVDLVQHILCKKIVTDEMRRKFIILLISISRLSPRIVSIQAMKALFGIVSDVDESNKIQSGAARIVLPFLIDRSRELLDSYLRDDKRTGNLPLSRYRRDEVIVLFEQLKSSNIAPDLFEKGKLTAVGQKHLVVLLFPIISEFIGGKEDSTIRMELLDLFRLVSKELGLN